MIIIRHSEECAGKPNGAGFLTGKCNCQTAKLDEAARKQLEHLLGELSEKSLQAGEKSEYFALRLDALVAQITKVAWSKRLHAKIGRRHAARAAPSAQEGTDQHDDGCCAADPERPT
jgi:hypothetical protein